MTEQRRDHLEALRQKGVEHNHTHCAFCDIELTPDVQSARSNHQCVSCHIEYPFGIYHEDSMEHLSN